MNQVDTLRPEAWESLLSTRQLGRGWNRYFDETDSTNIQVRRMAQEGAPTGSLCLCECQTAGRGRLGRAWHSPAGQGLWVSVLLRPRLSPEQAPLITLCAALAMTRAVRETTGLSPAIKWPNDVVCHGRKLVGILLEISASPEAIGHVVVGTGLNVYRGAYPAELAGQAASVEDFTAPPPRRVILAAYLRALEDTVAQVEQRGFAGIAEAYRAESCTLGSQVNVSGAVSLSGVAEDLDDTGALLVRTPDGELHRVLAGDVSVRGVMGYV